MGMVEAGMTALTEGLMPVEKPGNVYIKQSCIGSWENYCWHVW